MTLLQKTVLLILSSTLLLLSIEISQSQEIRSDDSPGCEEVLDKCLDSVDSKKEVISIQKEILKVQGETIADQENEIDALKETGTGKTVVNVFLSVLLVLVILI